MAIRIALDAMGGDRAPSVVVEGAIRAAAAAPEAFELLLFGPSGHIQGELARHRGAERLPLYVVDAPDVIGMAEAPAAAVKTKPHSSIHMGLGAHREGKVDAFISAGNTGAIMAAALFILGRQPGVARPSVLAFYPTVHSYCIVLDVGTNVDCRPEHLVQFAQMGTIYARDVMKRERPVVGLLNVGEEPGKGNDQAKAAYELLAATPDLNFRGNVEGRDVMAHAADVIVCDGFVGNIILKLGESVATSFMHMVEREMNRQELEPDARHQVLATLEGVRKRFDFEEYGGAPLLGVNGNVLIGHGSSSERAIEQMILAAATLVEQDVRGSIAATLNA